MNKQTILITGGTGNIGGGAALSLAKRGARVVLFGRSQQKLTAKVNNIKKNLSKAQIPFQENDIETIVIDLSDMNSVKAAAYETLHRYPQINSLILSAVSLVQNGPKILPNGHEIMFATNVLGPFLFTHLLLERLLESNGLILQIVAPFYEKIDWDDLENITNHKTSLAYNRTKTCNRMIAAELARRYNGRICSVAFDPGFIIDKKDPDLKKRWPKGLMGFFWKALTIILRAKPPMVAGEPIADLLFSDYNRNDINGAIFKLNKRIEKPDKAMDDEKAAKRLWQELEKMSDLANEK